MSMGQHRNRIFVRGLGNLELLERYPSLGSAFSSVGWVRDVALNDVHTMRDIFSDDGYLAERLSESEKYSGVANLWQVGKDELDLLINADGKHYAIRYSGMATSHIHQVFVHPRCKIQAGFELAKRPGEQYLPMLFATLKDDDLPAGFPLFYLMESDAQIELSGLQLWISPRAQYLAELQYVPDVSGWDRYGTLNADYTTIWQSAAEPYFLRFDGANDQLDLGDILDDDGTSDGMIEMWVRIPAADGTLQEFASKGNAPAGSAGWAIRRVSATNLITVTFSDGGANDFGYTSSATMLQNAWKHIAVTIDRNGAAHQGLWINGVQQAGTGNFSALGSMLNASSILLAVIGSGFGQVDIGDFRLYRWGAGGLPSNIGMIIARHYAAEVGRLPA